MDYRPKRRLEDLAILGGAPAFSAKLHVGQPNLGDRQAFLRRVEGLFDRNWLTNGGPLVAEFEERVASLSGARHCIAMCNGTVALEIAIRALELRGEVIVPAFTFVATAHALQWQHITPIFCDIDPRTHNLDPARVEEAITPRTTGILAVHLWGRPCAPTTLEAIAAKHGLKLLFDSAHALGCADQGRPLATFGDASVLSFHATKVVNTFEGGAILTNDDHLASKIRLMKNFGFSHYDQVSCLGVNGKMSEISAAMGLTGLDSFQQFVSTNYRNLEAYSSCLTRMPGLSLVRYEPVNSPNYQYVIMEIAEERLGLSRDALYRILHAENVLVRRYFYPGVHRMEPYRSMKQERPWQLEHTDGLCRRVMALPTGSGIGEKDAEHVSHLLDFLARHALALGSHDLGVDARAGTHQDSGV